MIILKEINCIKEATQLLNDHLIKGNILGGDFIGVTSEKINNISYDGDFFKFVPEDGEVGEIQFKFNGLKVIKINDEPNGLVFIMNGNETCVNDMEKELITQFDQCAIINNGESYKILTEGIVGVFNIQPQPIDTGVLLFQLRNKTVLL